MEAKRIYHTVADCIILRYLENTRNAMDNPYGADAFDSTPYEELHKAVTSGLVTGTAAEYVRMNDAGAQWHDTESLLVRLMKQYGVDYTPTY